MLRIAVRRAQLYHLHQIMPILLLLLLLLHYTGLSQLQHELFGTTNPPVQVQKYHVQRSLPLLSRGTFTGRYRGFISGTMAIQ